MLLGGLWHGASYNFIAWGGLHGLALAFHKGWRDLLHKPKTARSHGGKKTAAIILTFHFAALCWVFFRNSTFEGSLTMLNQIFTNFHASIFPQLISGYRSVFLLIIGKAFLFILLIYLIIQIKSADVQPFIYFQF